MLMLFKIAWKNIWRNKLRSFIVLMSIFLGIWAGIFISGLSNGMNNQRIDNFLSTSTSHIQIHNADYLKDKELKHKLFQFSDLKAALDKKYDEINYTPRMMLNGMIASANSAKGVSIVGINTEMEKSVTIIHEKVKEGNYFQEDKKNQLLIGQKLAEKLKIGVNKKVVVTFQDANKEIISTAFRIVGIYKSANSRYDEMTVFVRNRDLNKILQVEDFYHEIAIYCNDKEITDTLSSELSGMFPTLEVRSWKEIAPDLSYANEVMMQSLLVIMVIIMLALAFGILNAMLMAILERKRELGMLMAVGMNKTKVFSMIMIETILLSAISGPLGLLIGYITISWMGTHGLDLSMLSKGLEEYGYSTVVYTDVPSDFYWSTLAIVAITAILSSIYPAYKALKLNPVDSIRGL